MKPTAQSIADKIVAKIRESSENMHWEAEVVEILKTEHGMSSAVAYETAETILEPVREKLLEYREAEAIKGIGLSFDFSALDRRYLKPADSTRIRLRDSNLELLKKCSWDKFEKAAAKLLELAKCTKFEAGAKTKEGGLDFYGLLHIGSLSPQYKMLFDWRVRIFGQAKHWGAKVGEQEIHCFSDQAGDFIKKDGTAYKKSPEWFRSDPSPVLCVIVGLSGFTSGAETVCKAKGIIMRDGSQVADFLAEAVTSGLITVPEVQSLLAP